MNKAVPYISQIPNVHKEVMPARCIFGAILLWWTRTAGGARRIEWRGGPAKRALWLNGACTSISVVVLQCPVSSLP